MIALILAAGYGTRLYPLTTNLPKALLPVQDKPILDYLMEKITDPAIAPREILLVSNHRYFENFKTWSKTWTTKIPMQVLDDGSTSEENRLGSIGDLKFALTKFPIKEDLLVLGSDNLFADDLKGLMQFARAHTPATTLGAYELPDLSLASRYGVLTIDSATQQITQFEEKPKQPRSKLISTAIYFFPSNQVQKVLEYGGSADTLGSFIQWLIQVDKVFAYPVEGPWFDIGDQASYAQAQESFVP